MNVTNNHSLASSNAVSCAWTLYDQFEDKLCSVLSIILNFLTCPLTVLLNTLVMIAVKTKPSLQTMHNVILASMAVTDLAVGVVLQPVFIAREIFRLWGGWVLIQCYLNTMTMIITSLLCLTSLFHVVLIALERFIAMKYSLKYNSIVTTRRLAVAIALCWLFTGIYFPPMFIKARITRVFAISTSLAVICFCHLSVYFVCRRHLNRIKSEQISREARKKFLDDQKAWRTTIIVLSGFNFIFFARGFARYTLAIIFISITDTFKATDIFLYYFKFIFKSCYLLLEEPIHSSRNDATFGKEREQCIKEPKCI